jgi:lipopolysaccharide biosynthesis regulator YciM
LKLLVQGILVAAVLLGCETAPPVQEMSDARQAIAVAKEAGAAEKAAIHLKAAEFYLESAQQELNDRQYSSARYNAKQAKMKALDALKASESAPAAAEDESQ